MPLNCIILSEAEDDLDSIHEYIAYDNWDAAERIIADISRAIDTLTENPDLGRVREDLTQKPVRFFFVKHFVIAYHADATALNIVRILDGRRDIAALL